MKILAAFNLPLSKHYSGLRAKFTEEESENIFQLQVKGFSFATWIVTCDLLATTCAF